MLIKAILLVLVTVLASRIFQFVKFLGPHRTLYTHWPGPCRNVAPIVSGAEDIALTSQGLAFISSGYKTDDVHDERIKKAVGRVYLFDFNNPEKDAVNLQIDGDVTLGAPHGISLWEESGTVRIFLINHGPVADTVEVFKYEEKPQTLTHLETISSPLFFSMNDIQATSATTFYVTNDASTRHGLLKLLHFVFQYSSGSVVHYDGGKSVYAGPTGCILNGVTMSSDNRFVFVSFMMDQSVGVFRRNADNSLSHEQTIFLGSVPDNLFFDPDTGELFASCGIPIGFFQMTSNYDAKFPSHLLRIKPLGERNSPFQSYKIYDVFSDDGQLLSVSSIGVKYNNKLLLGTVFEKAAYCEIKYWDK